MPILNSFGSSVYHIQVEQKSCCQDCYVDAKDFVQVALFLSEYLKYLLECEWLKEDCDTHIFIEEANISIDLAHAYTTIAHADNPSDKSKDTNEKSGNQLFYYKNSYEPWRSVVIKNLAINPNNPFATDK